jgi:hypothetical protein
VEPDDDGFVTIGTGRRAGRPRSMTVVFYEKYASVPGTDVSRDAGRATWAWDGNGIVRLRFSQDGALKLTPQAQQFAVSAWGLYRTLGRALRGVYPITRIDGNDIYIDVSEAVAQ